MIVDISVVAVEVMVFFAVVVAVMEGAVIACVVSEVEVIAVVAVVALYC